MDPTKEKQLIYLLEYTEHYIENLVYDVLHDSTSDPHYSAVTASNLIKTYIEMMNELKQELPFYDIKSFFEFNLFTPEEYELFLRKYESELSYYVGEVY